jgi:hypothetical protein
MSELGQGRALLGSTCFGQTTAAREERTKAKGEGKGRRWGGWMAAHDATASSTEL